MMLLIGLLVVLALATWGSCFFIKRSLAPMHKIALTVEALSVADSDDRLKVITRNEVESACVTVSEMIGRLEESFQIGAGAPAGAFDAPSTRLAALTLFKKVRLPIGRALTKPLQKEHCRRSGNKEFK
jgi:hypothetical protein